MTLPTGGLHHESLWLAISRHLGLNQSEDSYQSKNDRFENITDSELADLLTNGDQGAFEFIYHKYVHALYGFARKNISSKDDSEEIIQDIFVSLWQRATEGKLGTIKSIKAYLFSMVKYKTIRFIQHSKVVRKYEEHFRLFEALFETAESNDNLAENIHKIIEELPTRCKQAISLRLYEGLSNPEIAQRMNITVNTVQSLTYKAFAHFKKRKKVIYGA